MSKELWDAYDKNRRKLGYDLIRGESKLKDGEYHIVVEIWIINSKGEILITKRSALKKEFPLKWECTTGSVIKGETAIEGARRELKEEIGLEVSAKELILYEEEISDKDNCIVDKFVIRKDFDLLSLAYQDDEVIDAKWVSKERFDEMYDISEVASKFLKMKEEYYKLILLKQKISYDFLGNTAEITIDRKAGSHHPKHKDMIYPINYGYVKGVESGDGEDLDAYIIDSNIPMDTFKGKCIGILQRTNDDDDKLIIVDVNNNKKYTEDEIKSIVDFQEKYFRSFVVLQKLN